MKAWARPRPVARQTAKQVLYSRQALSCPVDPVHFFGSRARAFHGNDAPWSEKGLVFCDPSQFGRVGVFSHLIALHGASCNGIPTFAL